MAKRSKPQKLNMVIFGSRQHAFRLRGVKLPGKVVTIVWWREVSKEILGQQYCRVSNSHIA